MVNEEKRRLLKAIGILIVGYFLHMLLSNVSPGSSAVVRPIRVDGDGSARVKVEDGALVVE